MNFRTLLAATACVMLATQAAVAVIDGVKGDYNQNGEVDAPDYNVWRDNFNSTTELAADGNENGFIDAPDYNCWRDNFGTTAGSAVPEPSSMALLLCAIIGLTVRLRRRC